MTVASAADDAVLTWSSPRYSSYVEAFDRSSSRVAGSAPRMTSDAGFGPLYSTTPAADVTRTRQVVVDLDVAGETPSAAAGGEGGGAPAVVPQAPPPGTRGGVVGGAGEPIKRR